ncbi:protein SanA [Candidatus Uhrbacteria bacterium CG10_big_fil_rev_8_21_14_0_10_50_16]|uniref:Protein SanA n=1 Tax=Candidatus Uhrbacteria bacterium CG10_big_fil_rev_8_21_14_0_10_50_16 TaxID=1975039 RepID=A0A2H0RNL7_9BACT|nr:MAG: protein SanA [Candidatus Uhrbacteria bacterium CG10_big_fil_rev_8_21_14_0_10_50_16]
MNTHVKNNRSLVLPLLIVAGLAAFLLIGYADFVVNKAAEGHAYTSIAEMPHTKTALLLGTSKYVPDGRDNLFYTYRMNAAVELFEAGKVDYILISGDNGTLQYSEPKMMQTDLLDRGIPSDRIYLDYAGFRTWDSVVRANKVFLENNFVIVSQAFQNQRALYIAQTNGIEAIAYNVQDVSVARSPRIWLRERLARVKVLLDVLLHTQPKFLGDTIEIGGEVE